MEDELERALGENSKDADEHKILLQKVKSLDEHQIMLRKHIDDKDTTIKSMLHKNNGNTPERITKSVQTDVNGENHVQVDGRNDISRLDVRTLQLHLESGINDKLAEFAANILDSVSKVVENKIGHFDKKLDTSSKLPEKINKNCESFAEALKKGLPEVPEVVSEHNTHDIRIAVKEALIEGKKDEMRIDDRKKNIILFNVAESQSDTPVKRKKEDISFFLRDYMRLYAMTTRLKL